MTQRRVAIAMSGGVDSSVAAALLKEQGYDVLGIMMRLWAEEENRCCSPQAFEDAQQVASQLDIPFHVVDYQDKFRTCVVDYFIEEYSRGRTPNPCLACNRHIRFGMLLRHVHRLGASHLATGHYAQVGRRGDEYQLRMGVDGNKDQSYVLYRLGQEELGRVLFPVGAYTKPQVRAMARQRRLPVASRDESMELCFVTDDDYRRFLRQHAPDAVRPGPILDTKGREIGQHQGLPFYTIGQRKGMGIAASQALYVIRLESQRNALIVGPSQELGRTELVAESAHYVSGRPPEGPVRVQAKIRYKAQLADAIWTPTDDDRAHVEFLAPLRDITPGQAVVAYQGDEVVGGGIISG